MNTSLKSVLRSFLPRANRGHRILGGPLRGAHLITSWHDYPAAIIGRTERRLLDWFAGNVKPGETWLDIGAHYGYTAIALSRLVGKEGRVIAFEPMISTAGYVTQTRQLNNFSQLIVLPLGLACPETLEIKQLPVTRGMVDSTLCKGEACPEQSRRSTSRKDERQALWQETILVARLDWLWEQICGRRENISGVKIDVQGMELEVLRGMKKTLGTYHPKLVVEFHPGVNRDVLLDLIANVGYDRVGRPIEPVPGEVQPQYVDDRSYAFNVALNKLS